MRIRCASMRINRINSKKKIICSWPKCCDSGLLIFIPEDGWNQEGWTMIIFWALRIENRARLIHFWPKSCHFWQIFICGWDFHTHPHMRIIRIIRIFRIRMANPSTVSFQKKVKAPNRVLKKSTKVVQRDAISQNFFRKPKLLKSWSMFRTAWRGPHPRLIFGSVKI